MTDSIVTENITQRETADATEAPTLRLVETRTLRSGTVLLRYRAA